jgi:hypothetical protein
MSLAKALSVVHDLYISGVISRYAITGAVGALAYIQPTLTQDVDVLVEVEAFDSLASGLLLTSRLDAALAERGYTERLDVGIVVEGWPIQFIPVSEDLDLASLEEAKLTEINSDGSASVFVLRAEHVIAKALKIGRSKDYDRVSAFLNQGSVDLNSLRAELTKQNLSGAWALFCDKTGYSNVLGIE